MKARFGKVGGVGDWSVGAGYALPYILMCDTRYELYAGSGDALQ